MLAAIVALAPLVLRNNYAYDVATQVALNAIVCVGLNLLIGYAGQISLGHAGFFALGGYGSAILATRYGVPVWVSLPLACALVGVLAFVIGRPTLRLKGHTLAMATLGLGIIISIVLSTEDRWTGGPDGMAVPPLVLFGWIVKGERTWYWLAGGALLLAVWLAINLIESPTGRALRALHGSEVASETLGIRSARYKLQVFVLSAVFAARGRRPDGALRGLHHAGQGLVHAFGGTGDHGRVRRHGIDLRRRGRRGRAHGAAAAAHRAAGLRDDGVRRRAGRHHGVLPAGHRAHAGPLVGAEVVMNAAAAPLLDISNLSKAFGGVHAIEGLAMQVQRGAVHSVIGPNGAGKTSLINMLSGVYRPDTGSIRLAGPRAVRRSRCTPSPPPASAAPSRTCRCSST